MTVIVCGGRHYFLEDRIFTALDRLHGTIPGGITTVVTGGCAGADHLAMKWAHWNKIPCREYHAEWDRFGRSAGPIRNRLMLDRHPEGLIVAFPGGKGTANLVGEARRRGRQIWEAPA